MDLRGPIFGPIQRNPSRRDFWFAAYLAALPRLSADDALTEADRALALCNERWRKPPVTIGPQYRDDCEVGHELALREPDTDVA